MVDRKIVSQNESNSAEEWIRRAQELASLLVSDAARVLAFKGRWMVISRRLQKLSESIVALTGFPSSGNNAHLESLLPQIVSTLEEGKELAKRSIELNYGGKLLMQSNLDAFATKLDLHLRDSELLGKSGFLRETAADLAIGRAESFREGTDSRVGNLFAKLRMVNRELKKSALDALIKYLKEDGRGVSPDAEKGGFLLLIRLLDSGDREIREKAGNAVALLAQADDACRQALTAEGAHAPLIRLLESGSPLAKEKAAEALQGLTSLPENAHAVAMHGGIAVLVDICRNGTPGAMASAAGTLRNLSMKEEFRSCLAEEGAIAVLIRLVTSGTALAQENATETLQNLASGDDRLRSVIARQGGIQSLLMYLDRASYPKAQEIAIRALRNLAASATNAKALISAGYVVQLAAALKNGTSAVQQLAASAICNLSASIDVRRQLGEAGCIPPLTRMLEAPDSSEQEAAAQALSTLLLVNSNRREFCKEEKSISRLVQLLDPRNQSIAKRFPISALLALSGSSNCRKRIMSAGARQHLEKLAEMDVAGAKKTLDKIGGRKLLKFFGRHRS